MPYTKKQYQEIVQDILAQVVQGIAKEKQTFSNLQLKYELECRAETKPVKDIVKIEGFFKGNTYTFQKEKDYRLNNNHVEWFDNGEAEKPDDRSNFTVTYIFDDPPGLTDINTGSVLRTFVESMSREIELLYEEMDQVYQAGFIDTANGPALDLVVSMLGIKRKSSTNANGLVTFWKDSDPPEINASESILYDGRESYELKAAPMKVIEVTASIDGVSHVFQQDKDYLVESNLIKWIPEGIRPEDRKEFSIEYVTNQIMTVPAETVVSTYAKQSKDIIFFRTLKDGILKQNNDGKWETTVEIAALSPGTGGNALAGTIKIMPKPPLGIDKVINRSNIGGGTDAEPDNSLRERAKKVLDVKGKATLESLRTALEGIDGIQSPPVLIDMPDGVPGIVKAIIDGGNEREIQVVIENVRAAGILVEFDRPKIILLDIDLTLSVTRKVASEQTVISAVEDKIKDFVSALKIGDDLIVNQLISVLLRIPEVLDINELKVNTYREGNRQVTSSISSINNGSAKENIIVNEDERPYVRNITVKVEVAR
jgi:Baseplate J-like protein